MLCSLHPQILFSELLLSTFDSSGRGNMLIYIDKQKAGVEHCTVKLY